MSEFLEATGMGFLVILLVTLYIILRAIWYMNRLDDEDDLELHEGKNKGNNIKRKSRH